MSIGLTKVQQLLDTQLVASVSVPIEKENTLYKITEQPFVRATLVPAMTVIASLGVYGYDRLSGLYVVDVFFPLLEGKTKIQTQADAIMNAFPKGLYLIDGNTKVLIENRSILPARKQHTMLNTPVIISWVSFQQ